MRCLLISLLLAACETVQVQPAASRAASPTEAHQGESTADPQGDAIALAVGTRTSCAARENGELWCWGIGADGMLGESTGPGPVRVAQAAGLSSVWVGASRVCYLANDEPWCFGNLGPRTLEWRSAYQRGASRDARTTSEPTKIGGVTSASSLALGEAHICLVDEAQAVRCGGVGAAVGGADASRGRFRAGRLTPSLLDGAQEVSAGRQHSCALSDGKVWCWGNAYSDALGPAPVRSYTTTPTELSGLSNIRQISTHPVGSQTCVLREQEILCWGSTGRRVLGREPIVLPAPASAIREVVTGLSQVLAVDEEGAVYRYVINEGDDAPYGRPQRLDLPPVQSVGIGSGHTCALTRRGAVFCWGLGAGGRLGTGLDETSAAPVRVEWES